MSIVLDAVVIAAGLRVAALSRVTLVSHVGDRTVTGWGHKEPLAILIEAASGMRAFDPQGRAMSRAAVEVLQPGVWAALEHPLG